MRTQNSIALLLAMVLVGTTVAATAAEPPCEVVPVSKGAEKTDRYLKITLPRNAKVKDLGSPDSFAREITTQDGIVLLDYGLDTLIERRLKKHDARCELTINGQRTVMGFFKEGGVTHAEGYVVEATSKEFRGYLRVSPKAADRLPTLLGVASTIKFVGVAKWVEVLDQMRKN